MKKEIKFAIYSVQKYLESSAENRISFIITVIVMALNDIAFLVLWYSFGTLAPGMGGWQPMDAFLLLGFNTLGFGICYSFLGGVRSLPEIVVKGNFDQYLLSPKNILLRVSTHKITLSAMGDAVFGIICIALWFYFTGFSWFSLFLAIYFTLLSASFYYAFAVFTSSFSFYFNDARPIVSSFVELVMMPAMFYGGAVKGALRVFFLFIIPSLLIGVFPVETMKNYSFEALVFSFFMISIWLLGSICFFNRSVKKYESGNFINFG